MSMRCEDVRPLLAELVYEEVDPEVAEKLREHLGTCLSCRRHQNAFLAVRRDLQEWPPARQRQPGIRFIAPGAHETTPIWHSRIFQGLAAAAGFVFVAVLIGAAVNLQVQTGPEGWALSTSFGAPASMEEAEPPVVALEQVRGLDAWFDARLDDQLGTRLADRGVVTLASMPEQDFFTDGQMEELTRRMNAAFDETFEERNAELQTTLDTEFANMRYYVDASVETQADVFFYSVANMVEGLEAEYRDQLFQLGEQFGALYANTDRKLDEAHFRIDSLTTAAALTRSPEQ